VAAILFFNDSFIDDVSDRLILLMLHFVVSTLGPVCLSFVQFVCFLVFYSYWLSGLQQLLTDLVTEDE